MLKRIVLVAMALSIFAVGQTLAAPKTGCKKFNFTGTYLAPSTNVDVFGDGSAVHSFVFQLKLNSDGSAEQYWTGLPDFMLNAGSGSPQIGSWTCRNDGKLIINLIQASYFPVGVGANPNVATPDIELASHSRTTYLFSVDSDDSLTRLQSRTRRYLPNEDPSDPNSGTLLAPSSLTTTYTRLTATDADLLLP